MTKPISPDQSLREDWHNRLHIYRGLDWVTGHFYYSIALNSITKSWQHLFKDTRRIATTKRIYDIETRFYKEIPQQPELIYVTIHEARQSSKFNPRCLLRRSL